MRSLTTYITFTIFLLTFSLKFHWTIPSFDFQSIESSSLACPNVCQVGDSLALIAIFNATSTPGWTAPWITSQPVCTPWAGVELDNEGYVIRLTLNNNNLTGTLPPEIGNLSRLGELQLDNNSLTGNIPPEIGNLSLLEICFLDNNNLQGTIPQEFGNLSIMHTLYLDNNQLTGAVPNSFNNLGNLFKFDIFNNNIDSIPDLSGINLQPNKFRIYNNQVTFDDIVLNDLNALGTNYTPQDSVNQASTINLQTGDNYTLDLGFDNGISDNQYQWYKDGVTYGPVQNTNKLNFSPVIFSTAGVYRCEVTNPNAPLLTLYTRPVTIVVTCGTSINNITEICSGGSVEINTETYDVNNPTGLVILPGMDQYGCDSMIIINLTFLAENITPVNDIICIGDTLIVNGTVYDFFNPSGTEILPIPDDNGCDSILDVDLTFYTATTAGTVSPTICPGDSIELFGVFYSAANPTGTVILDNASATGCDSTLLIEVQFHPPSIGTYNPTTCEGGSIDYAGQTFDASFSSGQVNLGAIAQHGCDSLVNVNLGFYGPAEGAYEATLCAGDSVVINNMVFNQSTPTGTVTFPNGSVNSCDSVVIVNLSFGSTISEFITQTLCNGDSIVVNNVSYNEANPNGSEMIPGGSSTGCDSTVIINLSFHPVYESIFEPTLCFGDSVIIQGTTYNAANPNGTETFLNGSTSNCDSTVNINLRFYPFAIETLNPTLCPGDSILVNNIVYNESNPTGTEVLTNLSSTGCDSTVNIDLSFYLLAIETLNPTLCPGDSIFVNSIVYNESNPAGTEIMQNEAGCDSTIIVDLSFYPNETKFINDTLCSQQGIWINNTPYNESNPSGTEIIPNGSVFGCDSTIVIDLSFIQAAEGILNSTLCPGDSVVINGVTYNENNLSGIQFLENQAASGCDSTVIIDLSYYVNVPMDYSMTLCPGDSVVINNTTYNDDNPNGIEILEGANINGCDSTVVIALDFHPSPVLIVDDILCEQDELTINGQPYNSSNPSGIETIENGSVNGCDSIIVITLTFKDEIEFNLNPTLCPGDSLTVNNVVYNQSNPIGTETITGGSSNGCDSIVLVNLAFFSESIENINDQICFNDSVVVNEVTYDFSNPSGTEIIQNASVNGCDSTVNINLSFYAPAEGILAPTICEDAVFEFNGSNYDINTPAGTEVLEGASLNGCDSTVQVQLSFYAPAEGTLDQTLCHGDSLVFNGTVYNQNNPTGTEVLDNASINGCDSLVQIQLFFNDAAEGNFETTLCDGDSILFNGIIYNQSNASGTAILENASSNGCDSTIQVLINFFDPVVFETSASICEGGTFDIAGNSFTQAGIYDLLLENASVQGCDSTIILNLEVLNAASLGTADAGEDIYQCDNFVSLQANQPVGSNGLWTSPESGMIDNPESALLNLENLEAGRHIFIWTLSVDQCMNYDSDTVQVFIQSPPNAVEDVFNLDAETEVSTFDFLQNDDLSNSEGWTFELLSEPTMGTLSEIDEGLFEFNRTGPLGGTMILEYQLCNEDCPNLCDTASVRILIEQQNIEELDIPNAITPNGDGVNETFMFPHLEFEPDRYPDKELIIFNRWGEIIYEVRPYQNDWGGVDRSGRKLPQGTYYFILNLDVANGIILKGDVSILK